MTLGEKAKGMLSMALRTALLAAIVLAVGFVYMAFQEQVMGTDFFAWFFGVKDFPIHKLKYYLPYLAVFCVAFIVLSIDMNVERHFHTTGSEFKDLLIAMIVNVVLGAAMITIIVAVKWHLQTISSPLDKSWLWSMGLSTSRIWGMPLGMGVACAGSTFLYRKTGNIWLCSLLIGSVACLMGCLYGQISIPSMA